MPYATPADMLERVGPKELAEVATPRDLAVVSPELMRDTIEGNDRSAYAQDEKDAADAALARIEGALADAQAQLDGYLGSRYSLPLASPPAVLTQYSVDVARFRLFDDAPPEAVKKRYDGALQFAQRVAKGEVAIGVSDQEVATGGSPEVAGPDRTLTEDGVWGDYL
jgi:phage gp36-like protein